MNTCTKVLLCIVLLLPACSAMDAAKIGMGIMKPASNGISASAQIGKEANKQVIAGDQVKTELDFKNKGAVDYRPSTVSTEITNINPLFMILLILGWLLPSPGEIWNAMLNLFKRKEDE